MLGTGEEACVCRTHRLHWITALGAVIATALSPAIASEGGSRNLKSGAFTFAPAVMPEPGSTAFMGYVAWLRGTSLHGDSGDAIGHLHLDLAGHAGRLMHTWDFEWHGLHLTSTANYLIAYARTNFNGIRDHDADLSALNIEPFMVSRTFHPRGGGTVKWMSGINYWFPIGHYEPRGNTDPPPHGAPNPQFLANAATHANYGTGIFETAFTWNPVPTLQIDSETYVGFNVTNHRTDYRSGNVAGTELGVTAWPFSGLPRLGIGAGGYYLHQFENDHVDGQSFPHHKLEQIAVGPQATYTLASGTTLIAKWQHAMRTRNAVQGDLFWVLFYIPVAGKPG
ncbi:MAG: transporter [Nevskiaceae bacterium]|nr:MAG: transporter [Nevskiaceae bacterium]TBR73375.1 MAG: transporter [Nevskiaceae bacterium]